MSGSLAYLGYMLIFTLVPISLIWAKHHHYLRRNWRVLAMVMGIGVLYQLAVDPFAEAWHAWFFTRSQTLGLWFLNFPIENTIFFALVSFAIASAMLALIEHYGLTRRR